MAENKVKYDPLLDRVIIKLDEMEKVSPGGIHLPDESTKQEKVPKGEVLAVGPGFMNTDGNPIKPKVKVGDRVLVDPMIRLKGLKHDGQDCIIVREVEILAVEER